MYLCPRTGVKEVDSNEDERTSMMSAIRGNIFALKYPHIRHQIVGVPIAVLRSAFAPRIAYRREAAKVCNHIWLYIDSLKTLIHWPWSEHVDQWRQHDPSRDGNGLGLSRCMPFFRNRPSRRVHWLSNTDLVTMKHEWLIPVRVLSRSHQRHIQQRRQCHKTKSGTASRTLNPSAEIVWKGTYGSESTAKNQGRSARRYQRCR